MTTTDSGSPAPAIWGESSRNVPKVLDILGGRLIRAGIYASRADEPDLLVAIVSRWRILELRVSHPENKRRRGSLIATGAFTDAPAWVASLEDGTRVGVHRDLAVACGLITGITA